jgi:hypothetical protein
VNLSDQLVSLKLAKKLEELGVKQNSYFKYELRNEKPLYYEIYHSKPTSCAHEYYSAFTVAELIDMLPTRFYYETSEGLESCEYVYLRIVKYPHEYQINYYDHDDEWFNWYEINDKSLPDSCAKMLIYLIENGLVKVEDIND